MKKKEIISAAVISVFLIAILAGTFFLTRRQSRSNISEPLYSSMKNGEKIFYLDLFSIDAAENKWQNMISDIRAFGSYTSIGNIENLILYFSYYDEDSGEAQYYKYDTITRQISMIEYESEFEVRDYRDDFYAYKGYLYYFAWNIPEDMVWDNVSNYLCRIPVSGGKEEIICEYTNRSESICFITDDAVITKASDIMSYDLVKNKKTVLWNAEANGYAMIDSNIQYYDGNLYFLAYSNSQGESIETIQRYTGNLISYNIKTKKSSLVSEIPISCFYLTSDKIYYVGIPSADTDVDNNIVLKLKTPTVYSCSLNGKNAEEICTNKDMWIIDIFYVNEDKIFYHDGNAETHKASYFSVDRATGETEMLQKKNW